MGYIGTAPGKQVVTSTQLADAAVTSTKIADGAVITQDIANAAVTQAKLAANVAGNGPAFSATSSSGTSCANNTFTKIAYQTEEFDVGGCYNNTGSAVGSAPAYSFNPQVAGYYQISFCAGAGTQAEKMAVLYKNGSLFKAGGDFVGWASAGSTLVYMNGTTDYVEVYLYHVAGSTVTTYTGYNSYFQAALVRAA